MGLKLTDIEVAQGTFRLQVKKCTVEPGQIGAIIGESGSGKSTLLNAVSGFLPMVRGTIRIGDRSVEGCPPEQRKIAVVFQETALFPHLTVAGNVEFGLKVQRVASDLRRQKMQEWLHRVDLDGLGDRYPHQLSGGQAQRVALARAFIVGFPTVALDEPFAALDIGLRRGLRMLVKTLVRETQSIALLVSHDPQDIAAMADTVLWLKDGKVVGQGDVDAVLPKYTAEREGN